VDTRTDPRLAVPRRQNQIVAPRGEAVGIGGADTGGCTGDQCGSERGVGHTQLLDIRGVGQ